MAESHVVVQLRQERALKRVTEQLGLPSAVNHKALERSVVKTGHPEEQAVGSTLTLPVIDDSFAEAPASSKPSVEWALDEDTLKALQTQPVDLLLPPEEDLTSNNYPEQLQAPTDTLEVSADAFIQGLDSWGDRARTVSDTPAGNHRTVDVHDLRQSSTEDQQSTELTRGMIIWRDQDRELHDLSSSGHNQDTGWSLDRLQNKVVGAQTWFGSEIDGTGRRGASVTIKVIWPHLLSDNPMMWQFDAEIQARALQQVDHPSIPKILGWGEYKKVNAWFIILEWIEGESLAHQLRRGSLEISDALSLFSTLGEGLELCHLEGIIHRKLQPAHIILSPTGPRLISFQWVDEIEGQDIQRGQQGAYQLLGQRPKFLAPEWMQEARITDAADVFALGACLLEAVSPGTQTWREAPPQLQACLAGALHEHPDKRSDIKSFLRDMRRSTHHYFYQAGGEQDHVETLPLHEVVTRIRKKSLSWHLLMSIPEEGDVPAPTGLLPWGEFPEVVEAVEQAQQYQAEGDQVHLTGHVSSEVRDEDLIRREELVATRSRRLDQREEELNWRDEALREREQQLTLRDVALQEEDQRLRTLQEMLTCREEELAERNQAMIDEQSILEERLTLLDDQHHELEARSAQLRVLEAEVTRREEQQRQELELKKAEIEAKLARVQEEELADEREQLLQIEEAAERLIKEREERKEALQKAEEEAHRLVKQSRLAEQETYTQQRSEYDADLQSREEQRIKHIDEDGAFVRPNLRRVSITPPPKEPDEQTHREFAYDNVVFRARYCPPGSTWCGSDHDDAKPEERPRHRVKLTQGLWFMETPVTQAQWSSLMDDNPSQYLGVDHPVESVTWLESVLFCNALSEIFDFESAYHIDGDLNAPRHRIKVHWDENATGFRLPTETEWEYAARAGLSGQRHVYSSGADLDAVGWFSQNSGGHTHPVGLKTPNRWGLFDLSGNIWEWCQDEWLRDAYRKRIGDRAIDPVHYNAQLSPKVIKGGAWYDYMSDCRLANRPGQAIDQPYGIGFRVCLPHNPL